MRKTQRIDLIATIRSTIVSFFAITMFVALGIGLFLGIHWISGSMHTMAAAQFAAGNAHDVEITFPYGLTEEDVAAIEDIDADDLEVEAGWLSFEELKVNKTASTIRVGTVPERIDTFVEVEGELPDAADQIALESQLAKRGGYAVGDTLTFSSGSGTRYLKGDTYTVTAIVKSPVYLASSSSTYGMSTTSGSVAGLAWVPGEAFNKGAYLDGMPYAVVRSERLSGLDPFSAEYTQAVAELEGRISEIGKTSGSERLEMVHNLADILNNEAVSALLDGVETYANLVAQHEAGAIDDAEYAAALATLGDTLQTRLGLEGVRLLPFGLTADELLQTVYELAEAVFGDELLAQLNNMRANLASLTDYAWIVLARSYNGSVALMEGYTGVTANLRWSMASLFLIVGLLVCYSAISRIVHEQSVRIGTKKALGFSRGEVNALFLSYAAASVAIGVVAGVLIAVFVVERILLHAMGNRFIIEVVPYVNVLDIVLIGFLELVLILGATWLAVSSVLKRQAVELLAGERPPTATERFYEKWGVWKRMGLLAQTTVNNCINDTRRVVGTLIGVAGCTALIACAVMLNDNVMRSFSTQYEKICHYTVVTSVSAGSEAANKGVDVLSEKGMDCTEVFQRSLSLRQPDGRLSVATITVPTDEEAFSRLMTVVPVADSDTDVATGAEGVWVSEAYHEHLNANVGDMVELVDAAGNHSELPIAGFFEWHLLSHQIIMSADLYQSSFGAVPVTNKLLIAAGDHPATDIVRLLRKLDGYQSTRDDYASNRRGFTEFSSLSRIVVAVYLALAVVMTVCILLNLDFMFVNEKKRELTVLMINGYSLKDAKGYIWHDSVVLTVLGIICGLLLGSVVGRFTIISIEMAYSSFLHGVSWAAVGIAAVGTAALSAAAILFALRRIKHFDLTDINRF